MAVATISRDLGSGGRDIGRETSSKLGYRFLDHEGILARLKAAGHKWERLAAGLDEHTPRLWEKYDWSYRGFVSLVQSTILDEAAADNVVIIGRGANYLLQDIPFALRVRVVAPLEIRIERIAAREGIDEDSARWLVERTDRQRAGFLLALYGKDGKDPEDYDMVFDSGSMPPDEIASTMETLLSQKELLKDAKTLHRLKLEALAADIKARLFTALPFFMSTLDVSTEEDGQSILVRGVVHLPREREMVIKEARKVAGEVPVRFELRYRQ